MKKILLLFLLLSQTVFAQTAWTVQTVPNTRLRSDYIHISDPDDWITEEYEMKINEVLDGIRSEADVFVVVLSSIGDHFVESFAVDLFNYWGIGEADLDNGVLILMVEDQHALRFETGYGVEDELPDALCQRIFNKVIVPYFKEGDYNGGLYAGVCSVAGVFGDIPDDSEVTPNQIASLKSTPYETSGSDEISSDGLSTGGWIGLVVVLLLNIIVILLMFRDMRRLNKGADPKLGDSEKASQLIRQAKNGIIYYPIIAILCLCPLVLLIYPIFVVFVNRKEKSYRNTPRYCSKCGQMMRRLSEEEEDAYMTDNQIFEEDNIKVKDYDIWHCDSCGHVMAIPFLLKNASDYVKCPSCKCLASKKERDETVKAPTTYSEGKGLHHYRCKKCGYHHTESYTISKLSSSSSSSSSHSSYHSHSSHGSFGGGHSGGGGHTGHW